MTLAHVLELSKEASVGNDMARCASGATLPFPFPFGLMSLDRIHPNGKYGDGDGRILRWPLNSLRREPLKDGVLNEFLKRIHGRKLGRVTDLDATLVAELRR